MPPSDMDKFWNFMTNLFKDYRNLNDKKILEIAGKVGLDEKKFNKDRRDPAILEKSTWDYEEGQNLEVRGIPALFMNGRRIDNRDAQKPSEHDRKNS